LDKKFEWKSSKYFVYVILDKTSSMFWLQYAVWRLVKSISDDNSENPSR
jgi:hypothetical protein